MEQTKFKGFDKVSNLTYKQKTFMCEKCPDNCDVTEIKTEDNILYYGDRCGRYSEKGKEKQTGLPNLFEERENILMSYVKGKKGKRKKIGLARGGYFSEFLPFWAVLFDELGFNVVLSSKTNKEIARNGLKKTTAEFCYPVKVFFGHYQNLADRVDYLFAPDIIQSYSSKFSFNGKVVATGWDRSCTCPYLQNVGCIIAKSTNGKIINPHISFRQIKKQTIKNLLKAFVNAGIRVRKSEMGKAFNLAEKAYFDFKDTLRKRGREILGNLKGSEKQKAVVIIGRPYSSYDEAMNLNLAKNILSLGFLPVPQDFLPLPEDDLSKIWTNEYSAQGQLLLNAANVIKEKGLNAVFLDYFGCGPNSFLKGFFAKEIEKPYLTLQIDEHTADAGYVTRLEAFLDSI